MHAEVASLLLLDENTQELIFRVALGEKGSHLVEKFRVRVGEGIAGYVAKTGESLIVNDTRQDKRFAQRFDHDTGFSSKAIICVPLKAKGKIIGVIEAINPQKRKAFTGSDLELFEIFADQAALAVENAKMHTQIVKQEKAKQELAIAREIQQNFLPDLSKMALPLEVVARTLPARDVGGDFYDAVLLDGDRIGLLIADVSGKGVPAALFMINTISNFRFLAPHYSAPTTLLGILNDILAQNSTRGMFVTLFYLVFDRRSKTMEFASAGHHPVLRRTSSGEISVIESAGGIPLGMMAGSEYLSCQIQTSPGDVFLLYTDGIIEARNKRKEEYSLAKLQHFFQGKFETVSDLTAAILRDVEAFTQGVDQHDDMTLLGLKVSA